MEGNDNETFGRNLGSSFSTLPDFKIQCILGSVSENERGHRQSRQVREPSSRGQSQPGQGRGQTGPFQVMLGHGWCQMGQGEGQSGGQIQGPSVQGWGNKGQGQPGEGDGVAIQGHNQPGQGPSTQGWGNKGQGQPGEGDGVAIQGHNQPGQSQYHDGKKKPQLGRGQTQPKQGQRQPEQGQGLSGHAHGLLGQGRGQPNQGLSQPRQSHCPLGQVQEPLGHAWGQLGQGQVGRGETGQVQQGQAQRMLLQAQANITEQHQPRQSTPPPPLPPVPLDWQENKDHVSRTYNSLRCEMNKLNMWKVRVHSELSKKEEAVRMAQETADALQKSTRQTQLENVHLSAQLQDVIDIKGDLMEKIRATRQMCDDLKGQSSSVQQTLTRAETEQEQVEAVHSSLKAELKTFAVTFSELNLKSQNDKNIALGKVEAAVDAMGRARWDFVNKLTIKESQAKEMSELLELKNEELKTASQKLQDSIESCARLEETERNFQARLEQTQKESGTLKLEVNRRREVESTLQAGMQNAERSFAEKEREFTASTAELRLSCDKLQHERRDLNVIVQNLEKANEELTAAASQRNP
ncbi:uncharacterized protein LOC142912429 [Petromyzon marinus]|uniref:uncharacterized protein LOC142912429 n=1 Tax=Petromyzon marinus TaxID=7757 RepID=UPI003F7270BD